ncbi:MAG: bifunctional phosphoglucose/phosphomannose isomerase [Acidimicrobiales bacterium]|nr:bifunctional phosphoglucose/phosphomannose isomerase [Acidimicrobiales bacterium]
MGGSSGPGGVLDSVGMWELTAGLPEQVEDAIELAAGVDRLPHHDDIENVVFLGMGGSGIAGDLVREVAGPFMAVPIVVHKGYSIPNFIGENTLVFAVSFSGNTEETLDAAANAMMQGGYIVALCNGGELAELARGWDAPHIALPDIPMPRAGIGAVAVPPLIVLERCGLFPGATAWVRAAVSQLAKRRDELVSDGSAARLLAERIGEATPVIYGGGGLGGTAAMRWKCQVNENAKRHAYFNQSPELCHNEICGWRAPVPDGLHVVNLRHEFEHPQLARRFRFVDELIRGLGVPVDEVEAAGEGPLAQLLDLVLFGDFVSLHLAYGAGVDPGPIEVLDRLKAELAES